MTVTIIMHAVATQMPSKGEGRGGKALHFEGYVYHRIREGEEANTFWRCQMHKSGCSARATSEYSSVVVRSEHNHPPAHSTLRKEKA